MKIYYRKKQLFFSICFLRAGRWFLRCGCFGGGLGSSRFRGFWGLLLSSGRFGGGRRLGSRSGGFRGFFLDCGRSFLRRFLGGRLLLSRLGGGSLSGLLRRLGLGIVGSSS
jgi:hypothetical protein